jgi:hypothetical protein
MDKRCPHCNSSLIGIDHLGTGLFGLGPMRRCSPDAS